MTDRATKFATAMVITTALCVSAAFAVSGALLAASLLFGVIDPLLVVGVLWIAASVSGAIGLRWYRNPEDLRERIQETVLGGGFGGGADG